MKIWFFFYPVILTSFEVTEDLEVPKSPFTPRKWNPLPSPRQFRIIHRENRDRDPSFRAQILVTDFEYRRKQLENYIDYIEKYKCNALCQSIGFQCAQKMTYLKGLIFECRKSVISNILNIITKKKLKCETQSCGRCSEYGTDYQVYRK
jgi:hypothetical protein